MEEKLREALRKVPRYYEDFETGIILLLKDDEYAMKELLAFINTNPKARVDDVMDVAEELVDLEEVDDDEDI